MQQVDSPFPSSFSDPQLHEKEAIANSDHGLPPAPSDEPKDYSSGLKLVLFMLAMGMSTFLVGLELGIISTAIPGITDKFHRVQDIGWYGCSTFLVVASVSSMWGKVFKYLNVKIAYLVAIFIVLVGSVLQFLLQSSEHA
jgi:hypothetical protein